MTKRRIGSDQSVYQGKTGKYASNDQFAIVQQGGSYQGHYINNHYYFMQIKAAKKRKLDVHTYVWFGVGSSVALAKACCRRYLNCTASPKGSIFALDYEDSASVSVAANTKAILAGMDMVKKYGYKPMLYSYKPYIQAHVDVKSVLKKYPNSLWIASYPSNAVAATPNFNYFPSMDGIAIWQFTSNHVLGGLDGNADLLGVTKHKAKEKRLVSFKKASKVPFKKFVVKVTFQKYDVRLITSKNKWAGRYVSPNSSWIVSGEKRLKGMDCWLIGDGLYIPKKYCNIK